MIIAVDFDGTCVTAKFPELGENIGAQYVLRELVKQGHQLILYTMRGHTCKTWDGQESNENFIISALKWFIENEIPLWGVNENPQQTKDQWTDSPKPFYNVLIDDYAFGCPLVHSPYKSSFVDWNAILDKFIITGILKLPDSYIRLIKQKIVQEQNEVLYAKD